MNTKITIRKILITMAWLMVGAGMITLLIAAIGKKNKELCSNYRIGINGTQNNFFIDEKTVTVILKSAIGGEIIGRKIVEFSMDKLEKLLEENLWIRDAELWFDNQGVLHVLVNEREPVARVMTTAGFSFYIDSTNKMMPLSDKISIRVPVFTSFPEKKYLNTKDSLLLDEVKRTSMYIMNNPFWMSQVAQIDITSDRKFEMIPVIGNHVIKMGDGQDIEKKFNRLFIFYKQVLNKTGFVKYSMIDVQYAGQVIGTRKGKSKTNVDINQLKKNVEKLLNEPKEIQNDTIDKAAIFNKKALPVSDTVKKAEDIKVHKAVMPKKTDQ